MDKINNLLPIVGSMDSKEDGVPLYFHEDYLRQTQTPGHPESPDRVRSIMKLIRERELPVDIRTPSRLEPSLLRLVHTAPQISRIKDFGVGHMDPDTFHYDYTYDISLRAAGGVLEAAESAVREKRATFAIPRPPGHHAGSDFNMGFCYFNNVAIAARKVLRDHEDIDNIAIVDIDAHHGNGTNDIFLEDEHVLYISTHQWGIFPGTGYHNEVGKGKGEGRTINLPLMGGVGDPTFKELMQRIIGPAVEQFFPDMIFVSLGADGHLMDPLTSLTLSTPGILELTDPIRQAADRCCEGRLVYELEGGYHNGSLAEVFVGAMEQVMGNERPVSVYNDTRESGPDMRMIQRFMDVQSSYWKL